MRRRLSRWCSFNDADCRFEPWKRPYGSICVFGERLTWDGRYASTDRVPISASANFALERHPPEGPRLACPAGCGGELGATSSPFIALPPRNYDL
jgi:hypothetical protein